MIEPAVGASVCASGSQVCSGKSGTLIPKASAIAAKASIWAFGSNGLLYNSIRLKVWVSPE